MDLKRIASIVLGTIAIILGLVMVVGIANGRANISYGAIAVVLAIVCVWIEKLGGRR